MGFNNKIVCVICGVVFLLLSLIMGESIPFCIGMGVGCGGLSFAIIRITEQKKIRMRNRSYEMDLPDFMTHIAMFSQAGMGIHEALERAANIGDKNKGNK